MTKKLYGFYSKKHYEFSCTGFRLVFENYTMSPACLYKTPADSTVTVTCVGTKQDAKELGYMWDDAVCVGEVTHYAGEAW